MTDLTFNQQLALTIIDKAVLASALVGVGYVANRALEGHKARESLRAKMAEERLPRIAAAMARYNELARETASFLYKSWGEAEERRLAEEAASPNEESWIGRFFRDTIRSKASLSTSLQTQIDEAIEGTLRERFWLGDSMTTGLVSKYQALYSRLVDLREAVEWIGEWKYLEEKVSKPSLIGRLVDWQFKREETRMLHELGLHDHSGADIVRMIDHVSRERKNG